MLNSDITSLSNRIFKVEEKLDLILSLLKNSSEPLDRTERKDFPSLAMQIRDANSLVNTKLKEYSRRFELPSQKTSFDDLFSSTFPNFDAAFKDIPDKEWAFENVQWYFRYINCWWPVFYEKDFMDEYECLYRDRNQVKGAWLVSFYSVLALAASRSKAGKDQKLAESFFSTSWYLIQKPGFFLTPQLEKIQALLIMIQFAAHVSLHTLCKALCGQACLMIRDLNLHRESANADFSNKDAELRRRVFWICYIFEITTSLVFGTPSVLSDMDIDCEHPNYEYGRYFSEMPTGDLIFSSEVSLTILKNEVRTKVYSRTNTSNARNREKAIWQIHEKLLCWERALPIELRQYFIALTENAQIYEELDFEKQRLFSACIEVYLSYCNTLIFLHRLNESVEGANICLDTARRAINVLKFFFIIPIAKNVCYLWVFLYCPFTPFLVLFSNIVNGKEPSTDIAFEDLNRMYSVNRFFVKLRDIGGDLAEKLASVTENFIHAAENYFAVQPAFMADAFDFASFLT